MRRREREKYLQRNIIPIADRLNKTKVIRLLLPIGRAQIEIVCSFIERIIQAGWIVVRVERLDLNKRQSIDLKARRLDLPRRFCRTAVCSATKSN